MPRPPLRRWKQADFQGLSAFFGQTHVGFTGIYDGDGEYDGRGPQDAGTRRPSSRACRSPRSCCPTRARRRQRLAAWVTDPKNPYFARAAVNRVWALLFGRPLVEPVDNLESDDRHPAGAATAGRRFHRPRLRPAPPDPRHRQHRGRSGSTAPSDGEHGEADEKAWAVFPLTGCGPSRWPAASSRRRPDHHRRRVAHPRSASPASASQNDFVKRYGDSGEDEFDGRGGTIPQRLLMMNGKLVHEQTKEDPFNASTRIAWMAPDDPARGGDRLPRRPDAPADAAEEAEHFEAVAGRQDHADARRAARRPVLDAHQLDGILMEPLSTPWIAGVPAAWPAWPARPG